MKKVKYRLEVNFLSKDREDLALETSSPIYTLEDGFRRYFDAIDNEKCVDDKEQARSGAFVGIPLQKGRNAKP